MIALMKDTSIVVFAFVSRGSMTIIIPLVVAVHPYVETVQELAPIVQLVNQVPIDNCLPTAVHVLQVGLTKVEYANHVISHAQHALEFKKINALLVME